MTATTFQPETVLCPHCGAESMNDDDLCRFCGKAMVALGTAQNVSSLLASGLGSLKAKVRPMTAEELEEHDIAPSNFSDPADPIWDDWHMEP